MRAAFKADVLGALARVFVNQVFANYRARAKRAGIEQGECARLRSSSDLAAA